MKVRSFPSAATILFWIIVAVLLASWLVPSITYETAFDEATNCEVIDISSVRIGPPNRIYPRQIPDILAEGAQKVFSTLLIICTCNGALAVLNKSGVFTTLIRRLCTLFCGKEIRLIALVYLSFSVLGLVVMPHCFIAFVPIVVTLSLQMGYDAVVGLAMILLGATTASMTGPLSAVTAICQESVGLPLYSGVGVRLWLFILFDIVNVLFLCRYAMHIRKEPSLAYRPTNQPCRTGDVSIDGEMRISLNQKLVLAELVATLILIAAGSSLWKFSTARISGLFVLYGVAAGFTLGYNFDKIFRSFCTGIQETASTCAVLVLVGATVITLEKCGIMDSVQYLSYFIFSALPGALLPTGILILICILNALIPSGPAKGVLLMPLLGPAAQMSGMTLQTTVLAYNMGDSFSNYFLPYDATTASYLEASEVPFSVWVKFFAKLFPLWMLIGVGSLTILYYVGYGPF